VSEAQIETAKPVSLRTPNNNNNNMKNPELGTAGEGGEPLQDSRRPGSAEALLRAISVALGCRRHKAHSLRGLMSTATARTAAVHRRQ
jgi:hypothetical protein